MRIHKHLNVPWLSYSVPFAVGPAKHSGSFVAYTLRGTPGINAVAWMSVMCVILGFGVLIYLLAEYGILGFFNNKRVPFPIPVLGFAMVQLLILSLALYLFRVGSNCSQIVVNTESNQAQIRNKHGYASDVALGSISVQSVDLVRSAIFQKQYEALYSVHAVFLHVGQDAEVLGVFKEDEFALQYANLLIDETNLHNSPEPQSIYRGVAGYMDLTKKRSGIKVLTNILIERPLEPIEFIQPHG